MIGRITLIATLLSLLIGAAVSVLLGKFPFFSSRQWWTLLAVALVADGLLLYGIFDPKAWVFGRVFWRGNANLRAISITFDDGPNEPFTSQILDILKSHDVKATFFVVGKNAEKFPDAVRREAAEGHEIGNHSYDHEVLVLKSPAQITSQISRTSTMVEKTAGLIPMFFRAPHGWRNPWLNRSASLAGCIPVAWTLGVWDTDRPGADAIVQRTLKGLSGGCVLLLHDGRDTEHGADASQLVEALPRIIVAAKKKGFAFLRLSEMIEETKDK